MCWEIDYNFFAEQKKAQEARMAGVVNDPSACFVAAMMMVGTPGLSSSLLPVATATMGVLGGTAGAA